MKQLLHAADSRCYPTPAHARNLATQIVQAIARDVALRAAYLHAAVRRIDAADDKRLRRRLRRQV